MGQAVDLDVRNQGDGAVVGRGGHALRRRPDAPTYNRMSQVLDTALTESANLFIELMKRFKITNID